MVAILDQGLVDARPELMTQMQMWADANARSVRLASDSVIVPGGEQAKNDFDVFNSTARAINECGICRKSFVLVAGGGAVLDAVGYAAASAHRGVRLLRMPTTTLAQADAGIGVKNGNAFGKKNFLGTFSPPWAVVNDTNLLSSLTDRHWRSGLSESVKVALLKDPDFFGQLQRLAPLVRQQDLDAMERSSIAPPSCTSSTSSMAATRLNSPRRDRWTSDTGPPTNSNRSRFRTGSRRSSRHRPGH